MRDTPCRAVDSPRVRNTADTHAKFPEEEVVSPVIDQENSGAVSGITRLDKLEKDEKILLR